MASRTSLDECLSKLSLLKRGNAQQDSRHASSNEEEIDQLATEFSQFVLTGQDNTMLPSTQPPPNPVMEMNAVKALLEALCQQREPPQQQVGALHALLSPSVSSGDDVASDDWRVFDVDDMINTAVEAKQSFDGLQEQIHRELSKNATTSEKDSVTHLVEARTEVVEILAAAVDAINNHHTAVSSVLKHITSISNGSSSNSSSLSQRLTQCLSPAGSGAMVLGLSTEAFLPLPSVQELLAGSTGGASSLSEELQTALTTAPTNADTSLRGFLKATATRCLKATLGNKKHEDPTTTASDAVQNAVGPTQDEVFEKLKLLSGSASNLAHCASKTLDIPDQPCMDRSIMDVLIAIEEVQDAASRAFKAEMEHIVTREAQQTQRRDDAREALYGVEASETTPLAGNILSEVEKWWKSLASPRKVLVDLCQRLLRTVMVLESKLERDVMLCQEFLESMRTNDTSKDACSMSTATQWCTPGELQSEFVPSLGKLLVVLQQTHHNHIHDHEAQEICSTSCLLWMDVLRTVHTCFPEVEATLPQALLAAVTTYIKDKHSDFSGGSKTLDETLSSCLALASSVRNGFQQQDPSTSTPPNRTALSLPPNEAWKALRIAAALREEGSSLSPYVAGMDTMCSTKSFTLPRLLSVRLAPCSKKNAGEMLSLSLLHDAAATNSTSSPLQTIRHFFDVAADTQLVDGTVCTDLIHKLLLAIGKIHKRGFYFVSPTIITQNDEENAIADGCGDGAEYFLDNVWVSKVGDSYRLGFISPPLFNLDRQNTPSETPVLPSSRSCGDVYAACLAMQHMAFNASPPLTEHTNIAEALLDTLGAASSSNSAAIQDISLKHILRYVEQVEAPSHPQREGESHSSEPQMTATMPQGGSVMSSVVEVPMSPLTPNDKVVGESININPHQQQRNNEVDKQGPFFSALERLALEGSATPPPVPSAPHVHPSPVVAAAHNANTPPPPSAPTSSPVPPVESSTTKRKACWKSKKPAAVSPSSLVFEHPVVGPCADLQPPTTEHSSVVLEGRKVTPSSAQPEEASSAATMDSSRTPPPIFNLSSPAYEEPSPHRDVERPAAPLGTSCSTAEPPKSREAMWLEAMIGNKKEPNNGPVSSTANDHPAVDSVVTTNSYATGLSPVVPNNTRHIDRSSHLPSTYKPTGNQEDHHQDCNQENVSPAAAVKQPPQRSPAKVTSASTPSKNIVSSVYAAAGMSNGSSALMPSGATTAKRREKERQQLLNEPTTPPPKSYASLYFQQQQRSNTTPTRSPAAGVRNSAVTPTPSKGPSSKQQYQSTTPAMTPGGTAHSRLVPVDLEAEELSALTQILLTTDCGCKNLRKNQFKITGVEEIQNNRLWHMYSAKKQELTMKHSELYGAHGGLPHLGLLENDNANTTNCGTPRPATQPRNVSIEDPYALSKYLAEHLGLLFEDVLVVPNSSGSSTNVNEVYLLHGTTRQAAEIIAKDGFDERLTTHNNGTLFGEGSYFTNAVCKSHKYSAPVTDGVPREVLCSASAPKERCVLIGRVLLGSPCITTDKMPKLRRPPVDPSVLDADGHPSFHDSVIGNGKLHKEFVVYEKAAALPYCLVRYTTTEVL